MYNSLAYIPRAGHLFACQSTLTIKGLTKYFLKNFCKGKGYFSNTKKNIIFYDIHNFQHTSTL